MALSPGTLCFATGSPYACNLDAALQVSHVLLCGPNHSSLQGSVDLCAELGARAVGGDPDRVALLDAAHLCVVRCQLELGVRALELELPHALDGGPRKERSKAHELERPATDRRWLRGLRHFDGE